MVKKMGKLNISDILENAFPNEVEDGKFIMDGETIYYWKGSYENAGKGRRILRNNKLKPIKELIEHTKELKKAFIFFTFDECKKYIFSFEIVSDFSQIEILGEDDAKAFDEEHDQDIIRMNKTGKVDSVEEKGYLVAIKVVDAEGNPDYTALKHYIVSSDNRTYHNVFHNMIEYIEVQSQKSIPANHTNLPHNLLVSGAPGTGKSHYLKEEVLRAGGIDGDKFIDGGIITKMINEDKSNHDEKCKQETSKKQYCDKYVTRVTFYEDYSYENFVGCYKPTPNDSESEIEYAGQSGKFTENKITYKFVPGPLIDVYVKAKQDTEHNYYLLIEELNRAKAASVFGDFFQLLDRDKDGISEYDITPDSALDEYLKEELAEYDGSMRLPQNLYIWATMNSADQGVLPLDSAFKRRWAQLYMDINPDSGKARDNKIYRKINGSKQFVLWENLREKINEVILDNGFDEDRCIGSWYFKDIEIEQINAYFEESSVETRRNMVNPLIDKLIYYLRQDIFRRNPGKMFKNETTERQGISMSDLRRRVRTNEPIEKILNIKLEWIQEQDSKPISNTTSENSDDGKVGTGKFDGDITDSSVSAGEPTGV